MYGEIGWRSTSVGGIGIANNVGFSDNVGFADNIGFHVVFLVDTGEVDVGVVECTEVNRVQMVGLVEVERFVIAVGEGGDPQIWVGCDVVYLLLALFFCMVFVVLECIFRVFVGV